MPSTTYATHGMHSYPAKLIPHIPHYFINNIHFSKHGSRVLDPFCGSGTVLVEAKLSGRNSFGLDINPLARLLTKVKTTALDTEKLEAMLERMMSRILSSESEIQVIDFPDIDYWFSPETQRKLAIIKEAVENVDEPDYRDFFSVCFSAIIRKCSFADPRISPACKSRRIRELIAKGWQPPVIELFQKTAKWNISQNSKFGRTSHADVSAEVIGEDARKIVLNDEAVDLIITSPPYINAQKYVRSTKLEIFWLGLLTREELGELDRQLIGTERAKFEEYKNICFSKLTDIEILNSSLAYLARIDRRRAYIAYRYFEEMDEVFDEIGRVLVKNGHFVLVIGNNRFYGTGFPTSNILAEMAKKHLFEIEAVYRDTIKSRGLMTKRNKTADMINCEYVLVFRK